MVLTLRDPSGAPVTGASVTCTSATFAQTETATVRMPGVYACGSGAGDWATSVRIGGVEVEHGLVHVDTNPNGCPGGDTARLTVTVPMSAPTDGGSIDASVDH